MWTVSETDFYKLCQYEFGVVLDKYGFTECSMERTQYNRECILFRNENLVNNPYILISAYDDFRDPECTLNIKLGLGAELDDPVNHFYSSVSLENPLAPELGNFISISRESEREELIKVIKVFESDNQQFLKGKNSAIKMEIERLNEVKQPNKSVKGKK